MLRFNAWLDAQLGRLDPVGQLARDALADSCWPRATGATLEDFQAHLRFHAAPEGAIEALEAACSEWAQQARGSGSKRKTRTLAKVSE